MPAGQPRPYLVPIRPNSLNMAKTQTLCAVLVASGLLNSYINFRPDWTKNDLIKSIKEDTKRICVILLCIYIILPE